MKRMPLPIFAFVALCLSVIVASLATFQFGCSQADLQDAATEHPSLAPATQKTEQIEEKADPIVAQVGNDAQRVKVTADVAQKLGVPYAGILSSIAAAVAAGAGAYTQQRAKRASEHKDTLLAWYLEGEPGATPDLIARAKTLGIPLPAGLLPPPKQ